MKLLTDEEIDYWINSNSTKKAVARAIEAAILEKIGEPVAWVLKSDVDGAEHFLKVRFAKPEHDEWYELYKIP